MEQWVHQECQGANFGDARLKNRLEIIISHFTEAPMQSIPANNNSWKDTIGTYRFLANEKTTYEKILEGHIQATGLRLAESEVVLALQDTTSVDLTGSRASGKLGHLESKYCRGIFIHPTILVTPEKVNLGIIHAEMWSRDKLTLGKKHERKQKSIEAKESNCWLNSYKASNKVAQEYPEKLIVSIGDRESDIYELFVLATQETSKAKLLLRAAQNRKLAMADPELSKLWTAIESSNELGTKMISLPETKTSKSRDIELSIKSRTVTLQAPYRKGKKLTNIQINAVLAVEKNPDDEKEKVEWLLLTTLEIGCLDEALIIIECYSCRWQIEIFFRTLKGGCKIEELQLETQSRLENAIACYMIASWRIQYLLMLGRQVPDLPSNIFFSETEIKVVTMIRGIPYNGTPPTINEMIINIAKFGGYLNRTNDGPPGVKTLWVGLTRVADFVFMYGIMADKKDVYN